MFGYVNVFVLMEEMFLESGSTKNNDYSMVCLSLWIIILLFRMNVWFREIAADNVGYLFNFDSSCLLFIILIWLRWNFNDSQCQHVYNIIQSWKRFLWIFFVSNHESFLQILQRHEKISLWIYECSFSEKAWKISRKIIKVKN